MIVKCPNCGINMEWDLINIKTKVAYEIKCPNCKKKLYLDAKREYVELEDLNIKRG